MLSNLANLGLLRMARFPVLLQPLRFWWHWLVLWATSAIHHVFPCFSHTTPDISAGHSCQCDKAAVRIACWPIGTAILSWKWQALQLGQEKWPVSEYLIRLNPGQPRKWRYHEKPCYGPSLRCVSNWVAFSLEMRHSMLGSPLLRWMFSSGVWASYGLAENPQWCAVPKGSATKEKSLVFETALLRKKTFNFSDLWGQKWQELLQ